MTTDAVPIGCALCVARNKLFHKLADEAEGLELRLKFWRAKDKVRAAGDAFVRTSKVDRETRRDKLMVAKKRVRTLRAELKAKGLRP